MDSADAERSSLNEGNRRKMGGGGGGLEEGRWEGGWLEGGGSEGRWLEGGGWEEVREGEVKEGA